MNRAHVIGMGRLGHHLALRLESIGITVHRWNRTPTNGARSLEEWTGDDRPDAVFLTVSDDAIETVANSIRNGLASGTWMIHHAGSLPKDKLGPAPQPTAVLWPPMTFQTEVNPDWSSLPLIVDTDDITIRNWARNLTPNCTDVQGEQRAELHLAAVLLGNLTAGWIGMVQQHLQERGLDAETLNPLVRTSVIKALDGLALNHVTGPAARNDRATLTQQADHLDTHDLRGDLAQIHHILTNRILTHHGHDPLPPLQAAPRKD